ncbi:MAG: DUF4136 domain-containing protein [Deltaproteobacteria bacterium]|nr:DUF4136 domain-containing protein [Deltaproteobacteria bacterium]MBT8466422.1 DUF4136 domain-containing protein [Deltaproteobacteria bacterium]NNK06569.1 DUF4136 domain-containing protein [Myxococcales bacterium]
MKKAVLAFVAVLVPALVFGCVRDVETQSAASFNLQSGQTWAWVPEEVETWQEYKSGAREARVHTNDAYVEQRKENREMRQERREEPVGPERRAERREESEVVYGESTAAEAAVQAGPDARTLKREHKHIQNSIEGELSRQGISRAEGGSPTYYVAYYLITDGGPVAATHYAAYDSRSEQWEARGDEDLLVIDIVDPATGKLLWTGSGVGNTRGGGNVEDRMRGVSEAVRHIMRAL